MAALLMRLGMTSLYTRIAGQSKERLAALSDGVFAFAVTVLVLDLRPPAVPSIHSEGQLGCSRSFPVSLPS
jgi:uncharacterized membrane protein